MQRLDIDLQREFCEMQFSFYPYHSTTCCMLVDVQVRVCSVSVEESVTCLLVAELSPSATLSPSTGKRLPMVGSTPSPRTPPSATATPIRGSMSSAMPIPSQTMTSGIQHPF